MLLYIYLDEHTKKHSIVLLQGQNCIFKIGFSVFDPLLGVHGECVGLLLCAVFKYWRDYTILTSWKHYSWNTTLISFHFMKHHISTFEKKSFPGSNVSLFLSMIIVLHRDRRSYNMCFFYVRDIFRYFRKSCSIFHSILGQFFDY